MKNLLNLITLGAVALALPSSGFAAEKKKPTAESAPPVTEGAKKPAEAGSAEAKTGSKPMGMYARVDTIDAAARTFTHKNKDGREIRFVVSDKAEIKNGERAARLADIKVGDTVSGSRLKKSDTEYEVVKITKFGIAPPKKKKAAGEKKPESGVKPEGATKPEAAKKPTEKKS